MNFFLFLKFSLVGLLGVGINFLTTWLLKDFLRVKKYYSNSLGYTFAMIFNFFGNKIWTFSSNSELIYIQLLKFLFVVLIGVLLNHLIVFYFHDKIKINFYISKLLAVAIVFIWNFFMHTYFTFNYFKYF
ncbi:MAG: glycosyl transferase family 2 [Crocinitomicaceae bacterium]|nr:glycosyl transferase family 2 [Crocinitomicaceae bacterium]|tara:strand:+ start:208 stop:597 length:390 start_codon:yes stop_codon:yes gene_type:complete